MSRERGIIRNIFNNFIKSFRPKQIKGNPMGADRYGNKYFEIPADPSAGNRRASRWFVPQEKNEFEQPDMPAEWESWLRGRREQPPTEEEIMKNFAISELKKKNAAEIQEREPSAEPQPIKEGSMPFPKYEEYEDVPGGPLRGPPKR